jgi:integrase
MTSNGLPKYVKAIPIAGRTYLYFRHGRTYLRLPDDRKSAAFHAAYASALAGIENRSGKALADGSIAAMIRDFKKSPEYTRLGSKTQRDYARHLDHLGLAIGPFQAADVRRSDLIKLRNKIAVKGDRTADLFVSVVSRCFRIGMDLGYVETNPAAEIGRINTAESYVPWTAAQRTAFESSNPPQHLYVGYMLSLWTSLRLGDVLRLARTCYDGAGFVTGHTKSNRLSGKALQSYLPAAAQLRTFLEGQEFAGVLFVTTADGRRLSERRFSQEFRGWLDGLGLKDLHFHGLRVSTATALAEAGASGKEIAAITGYRSMQMVEHYTKGAEQKTLANAAILKLDQASGTKGRR